MALTSIIQYEGDNSTFVWKSPEQNFNSASQLIVHESYEAVLFKNGRALDVFGAGRHTLQTQNLPVLGKVLSLPTGGKTPFRCEVYFVNKAHQMAIKWGTDNQVQYMDPTYNFPLQIGASGEMTLSVSDSKRLLIKLVGVGSKAESEALLTRTALANMFRAYLMSKIKPYIATTMQSASYSIFEIDAHLNEFSAALHQILRPDFEEYGISLDKFYVTNIARPDGETAYERFKDIHIRQYSDVAQAQLQQKIEIITQQTEAQKMAIEAQAIAQKRAQEGYTYQQERSYDVAEKFAVNEGIGEFTNLGVGIGAVASVGSSVGSFLGGTINDTLTAQPPAQATAEDSMSAFKAKVEKLALMKNSGLLTEDEFLAEKKKLLESL